MRPEDDRIMKILYSPAHYIHPSHLPEELQDRGVWGDVLVNYWIMKHCQLEDVGESWAPAGIAATLILSHWQQLPNVAHLIGGYLLRTQLMTRGAALMSDPQLLAFISLPLLHHIKVEQNVENINPSAWGAAFILGLAAGLPRALQQRLLLCFQAEIELPEIQAEITPNHINLFRMAISYANNFQR
ncbi:hypothetical protein [Vagococcus sp. WN89Y]|uniref:hypothetical protein n=1 Tax=Vagococcus sp. WN89Y TaxID=3457258 RepID=UPI003FCE6E10